jgi:hypothetical protein
MGIQVSSPTLEQVHAGQALYSRRVLAIYDWLVLGLSNPLIWRCPTSRLRQLYRANLSSNHLEVGVGTGYFLDRCPFPAASPRLVLLDLNPHCLAATAARIRRYHPQVIQANVLEPPPPLEQPFDSVGINYVLHCLPGNLKDKACVFDHLMPWLNPQAVVFGSTLLSQGIQRGFLAQRLMEFYNARGVFHNRQDSLTDLHEILDARFTSVTVKAVGCVALFVARKRRDDERLPPSKEGPLH